MEGSGSTLAHLRIQFVLRRDRLNEPNLQLRSGDARTYEPTYTFVSITHVGDLIRSQHIPERVRQWRPKREPGRRRLREIIAKDEPPIPVPVPRRKRKSAVRKSPQR